MMHRLLVRVVVSLSAVLVISGAIACSSAPGAPTATSAPAAAPRTAAATQWSTLTQPAATPASLARCLAGGADPACFNAVRMHAAAAATSAPLLGPPVFNNNQPVLNSGSTVTLSWTAPGGGTAISYVIEASSAPGGLPNLANFSTGNALTTLVVPNVPAGTYYVRLRAVDASGSGAASNEVQLIVAGSGGGSCPSAPANLSVSQSGGTVTLGWLPPASGVPTSYVIQAGSSPGAANLANADTGSIATTFTAGGVPAGSYYIRVYGRSSGCAPPAQLGPASNEVLLTIGSAAPAWSGQIACRLAITGPFSYRHDEAQTWIVGGAGQTSGPRTVYPVQWSAQGSGGGVGKSWTINSAAPTDLSVTVVASTGVPIFDRTTTPIIVRGGIVGSPTSFDLYEIDFPTIVASSPTATSVSGTYTRPIAGGDSPQQPGGSIGTLTCTWSLAYR